MSNFSVDVFAYGVPYGNDFWGKDENDRALAQMFYSKSEVNKRYDLIVREVNGKKYCYYCYTVYNNVIDRDGRPGSHFGLALCLDVYCRDFLYVYKTLELVFDTFVKGNVLKREGDVWQFQVSSLKEGERALNAARTLAGQCLCTILGADGSYSLLRDFRTQSGRGQKIPLRQDCYGEKTIESTLAKCGWLQLSPCFPSVTENECKEKLNELQQKIDKGQEGLKEQIRLLQSELEKKKQENSGLEEALRNKKDGKELFVLLRQVKEPIIKIAGFLGNGVPVKGRSTEPPSTWKLVRRLLPIVNLFLLLVILLVMPKSCGSQPQGKEAPSASSNTNVVDSTNSTSSNTAALGSGDLYGDAYRETPLDFAKLLTINLDGVKSRSLEAGKTYKATLAVSEDAKVMWEVIGAKENGKKGWIPLDDVSEVTFNAYDPISRTLLASRRYDVTKVKKREADKKVPQAKTKDKGLGQERTKGERRENNNVVDKNKPNKAVSPTLKSGSETRSVAGT